MLFSTSTYPNLDDLLRRAGLTRSALAEKTGMKYDTLGNKLRGDSDFTRSEMFKIRDAISEILHISLFLEEMFTTGSEIEARLHPHKDSA